MAYARVNGDGTIDAAKSKGVEPANVTHPTTGLYCFRNLSFTPNNAVASPQFFLRSLSLIMGVYTGCPAGTQVSVGTWLSANSTHTESDSPFTIAFN